MTSSLPAIVAASGLSVRMGSSKALLRIGGQSFLARIITTLREGGADPILVVVRDTEGPEGTEARDSGGVPIANPDPTPGPISSLQAGLRELAEGAPGVLFSPVDHPLFLAESVGAMIEAFLHSTPPVVAPAFRGRPGHPVLFGRQLFSELLSPDLPDGARTVVRRYLEQRVLVEVEDPGILADINTPEELEDLIP
jgi:CTP:molybdopterin cytidylyltransferase MocA